MYEKMPDGTFQLNGVEISCADLRLEINRATPHNGASPYEGGFDRLLVPSRLDVETGSERSFRSLESRRQVFGVRIDESLVSDGVSGFEVSSKELYRLGHLNGPKYFTEKWLVLMYRCSHTTGPAENLTTSRPGRAAARD